MAWEWLTDVVDWGADLVGDVGDTVGEWFDWGSDAVEGIDIPFSDELLAPAVSVGSNFIGPLTQQGTQFPTNTITGMLSNYLGSDMSNILGTGYGLGDVVGTGLDLWGDYRDADLAEAKARSYQDRLNLLNRSQSAMLPYTDPTQRAQMQAAEEQRLTGLMTPFVERAAYRGRASDLSQGVGDSSISDWRDKMRQQQAAELVQQHVVPTAAANVAQAGTNLQNLFTSQASMLTDQPSLIQQQAKAQQQTNPWANMFLGV